eukprot:GHVU01189104.1.p1 GENE.GHVU01189104.1~~GHVU01189104.1.p1  ORF type:complete len:196 (-),score=51.48 GHVU01189104.1:115-702(-)
MMAQQQQQQQQLMTGGGSRGGGERGGGGGGRGGASAAGRPTLFNLIEHISQMSEVNHTQRQAIHHTVQVFLEGKLAYAHVLEEIEATLGRTLFQAALKHLHNKNPPATLHQLRKMGDDMHHGGGGDPSRWPPRSSNSMALQQQHPHGPSSMAMHHHPHHGGGGGLPTGHMTDTTESILRTLGASKWYPVTERVSE